MRTRDALLVTAVIVLAPAGVITACSGGSTPARPPEPAPPASVAKSATPPSITVEDASAPTAVSSTAPATWIVPSPAPTESSTARSRTPEIRHGATIVSGKLPQELVDKIVRQDYGRLQTCYHAALRRRPRLEGRIIMTFTIDKKGTTKNVAGADSDLDDKELVACLTREFVKLRFPADTAETSVSYPLVFAAGDAAAPSAAPTHPKK